MSDDLRTPEELLAELRQSGRAIAKLAEHEALFQHAFRAYRESEPVDFQAALAEAGLIVHCRPICRWFCTKHCTGACRRLCGPMRPQEVDIEEMRQFAQVTGRLIQDDALLKRLLEIVHHEDVGAWRQIIAELQLRHFCHQLCHWLCRTRCQQRCQLMCTADV